MEEDVIIKRLEGLFREVFDDKSLILSAHMTSNDIDRWDSLKHMLLITEIENEFKIKLKLKELNKMRNVGEMIKLIQTKL